MVRRWSYINIYNTVIIIKKKIFFRKLFINFKRSILFKKYKIKLTKFKRKSLFRLKRGGSWYLYIQIFKHWLHEYRYCKTYFKFQYNNKISIWNFFSYNSIYFKIHRFAVFLLQNKNYFLFNFITKKILNRTYPNYIIKNINGLAYFCTNIINQDRIALIFNQNYYTTPFGIYSTQNTIITVNKNNLVIKDDYFDFINTNYYNLIMQQIKEFYKICNFLWIYILFKS